MELLGRGWLDLVDSATICAHLRSDPPSSLPSLCPIPLLLCPSSCPPSRQNASPLSGGEMFCLSFRGGVLVLMVLASLLAQRLYRQLRGQQLPGQYACCQCPGFRLGPKPKLAYSANNCMVFHTLFPDSFPYIYCLPCVSFRLWALGRGNSLFQPHVKWNIFAKHKDMVLQQQH